MKKITEITEKDYFDEGLIEGIEFSVKKFLQNIIPALPAKMTQGLIESTIMFLYNEYQKENMQ
jgi:hypothetical protein